MRFNEKQNALFLTGLRGWQTNASKDAGFYRIRYTGQKANLPIDLKFAPANFVLLSATRSTKRQPTTPTTLTSNAGIIAGPAATAPPQYKVPTRKRWPRPMEIDARLVPDGKTLTLKVDELQPVMQMKIQYNLKAADGSPGAQSSGYTINVVGDNAAKSMWASIGLSRKRSDLSTLAVYAFAASGGGGR